MYIQYTNMARSRLTLTKAEWLRVYKINIEINVNDAPVFDVTLYLGYLPHSAY